MARNRFSRTLVVGAAAAAFALAGASAAGAATLESGHQSRSQAAQVLQTHPRIPSAGAFTASHTQVAKIVPVVAGDGSLWLCNDETWDCVPWAQD